MRITICPNCRAKVSSTDTKCMDCGYDLLSARDDIVEQAKKQALGGGPASPVVANPAAAGRVLPGENAEEKRLRIFDKQEAEKLRQQLPALIVITVIALIATIALLVIAVGYLKTAGGLVRIKTLTAADLKNAGLDVFSDPRLMFLVVTGLALAALLCTVGEGLRIGATKSAISAVARGETPNVVGVAVFTQIGLIMAAFFCAPLGLVMGIMFKFSKDEDTRSLGSMMIYASLAAIALVVINWIWSLASASLPAKGGVNKLSTSWRWLPRPWA